MRLLSDDELKVLIYDYIMDNMDVMNQDEYLRLLNLSKEDIDRFNELKQLLFEKLQP